MTSDGVAVLIATGIYTFLTMLIFIAMTWQIRQYNKERQQRALFDILAVNRELLKFGIEQNLVKEFLGVQSTGGREVLSRYAQMWINFAYFIWQSSRQKHLTRKQWKALKIDVLDHLFQVPLILERWEEVKELGVYEREFVVFIDNWLSTNLEPTS